MLHISSVGCTEQTNVENSTVTWMVNYKQATKTFKKKKKIQHRLY